MTVQYLGNLTNQCEFGDPMLHRVIRVVNKLHCGIDGGMRGWVLPGSPEEGSVYLAVSLSQGTPIW